MVYTANGSRLGLKLSRLHTVCDGLQLHVFPVPDWLHVHTYVDKPGYLPTRSGFGMSCAHWVRLR